MYEQLKKPFDVSDIKWRVGQTFTDGTGTTKGLAMPYVRSIAIQDRLDDVFGYTGWKNEYVQWGQNSQLCGISFKVGDEWIVKWDGAENTEFEATKGGLSNAFKRSAVLLGIGRYLKSIQPIYVKLDSTTKGKPILKSEYPRLTSYYLNEIERLFPKNNHNTPHQNNNNTSNNISNLTPKVGNQTQRNSNVQNPQKTIVLPAHQQVLVDFAKNEILKQGYDINKVVSRYNCSSLESMPLDTLNLLLSTLKKTAM